MKYSDSLCVGFAVNTINTIEQRCKEIVEELLEKGWSIVPSFLSRSEVDSLLSDLRARRADGDFVAAGVGRGAARVVRNDVRGDEIHWLDPRNPAPAQRSYFDALEALRSAVNEQLFLGLFEFEGHYAAYPPGSFYKTHLDQFRGVGARTLTCVLYLNEQWRAEEGGALRLYLEGDSGEHIDVLPEAGTLVTFLSERFYHEVLPATRERMSVTGWFKRREG